MQSHPVRDREERKMKNMARKRKLAEKKEKENIKRRQEAENAKLRKLELIATNRITRSTRKDKEKETVHCLGPGCVNAARIGSKYCSHECGIQLQIR